MSIGFYLYRFDSLLILAATILNINWFNYSNIPIGQNSRKFLSSKIECENGKYPCAPQESYSDVFSNKTPEIRKFLVAGSILNTANRLHIMGNLW